MSEDLYGKEYLERAIQRVESGEAGVGGCEAYDADDFLAVCKRLLEAKAEIAKLEEQLDELDAMKERFGPIIDCKGCGTNLNDFVDVEGFCSEECRDTKPEDRW